MATMMDAFVRRFQLLTEQREAGDELIKVRWFVVDAMI